ncbi:MAG: cysteine desulfurase-like protein [Gemmatimonadaceae bacterium]
MSVSARVEVRDRAAARADSVADVAGVQSIRDDFPALGRVHDGHPVAYFDGPGGTQVPRDVVRAMADYLFLHNANTHWNYPSSCETDAVIAAARASVADFLGASPDEIAFGNNMTSLAYHVSRALAPRCGPGDEIVVTELDHHANIAPWTRLARERGLSVRWVRMRPDDGTLDMADLQDAIRPVTRLVAIGAASNALGTINDVRQACAWARAAGALTFVDAVHLAPHESIDVAAIGCDFLACSAYKFYGPHIGILFARARAAAELDVPKLIPAPDAMPELLETGTQNHEGIVGAAAAIDYMASLGPGATRRDRLACVMREIQRRGDALFARLWQGLGEIPGVRRYGSAPGAPRTPTLAFTVQGVASDDVARALAADGIFASHGDFYAATVIERIGHAHDGVVRAGAAIYTTAEEIERFIGAVERLTRRT